VFKFLAPVNFGSCALYIDVGGGAHYPLNSRAAHDEGIEEVDMILIQCDRLNWSSSVLRKAPSGEHGGAYQSYTGSKRNYDFNYDRGAWA
jgi:hypothetical protein